MSMNVKNCGNCDHFIHAEGFTGKCNLVLNCIGENVSVYNHCKDFKLATVTSEQINAFLALTRKENF